MNKPKRRQSRAFSLLELVIVVVIIGIIAAIAIPRMSRGSAGAADSALSGNLAILRNSIELFAAEHDGTLPAAATIGGQLTGYTNAGGTVSPTGVKVTPYIYGPYIGRNTPPLPVGARKGCTNIAAADAAGVGWIYDVATGSIRANTTATEKDVNGVLYSNY